jgi:hypothetical protein
MFTPKGGKGDIMSSNDKDEFFELLAHEKRISELYQRSKEHKAEEPSSQIDSEIIAMAKQQLADNSNGLSKAQTLNQQQQVTKAKKNRTLKTWQWPFSLVASVGFLGILFITQRDYFIHPQNIRGETGILNEPAILSPDLSIAEPLPEKIAVPSSFKSMQIAASAKKNEMLLEKKLKAVARSKIAINQTPKVLKEQMLDKLVLEDNSAKTSPMSLVDMSKLAELLKLELAIQKLSESEASALSVKMQQTLYEHLIQYQKSHADFKLTEKYFNVLTEKQVQKLKLMATEAIPES